MVPGNREELELHGVQRAASRGPVGTLERGLTVLAALGAHFADSDGMTLTQIAASAGLPKPTTARLLATLAEYGFVEREGKSYRVGYQCFRLGNLYTFDEYLQRRALPIMEALAEEAREVVQLATLRDGQVLYLERVQPQRSITVVLSRPGSTRPLYCTALGKAMLACFEMGEVEDYLEQTTLEAKTPATITSRDVLLDALTATRERGYAVDEGESDEEVGCVAAPILDGAGGLVAAMSVSAPRYRMSGESRDRAASLICSAAAKLSGG